MAAVAVGLSRTRTCREIMQSCKTGAISVDSEHCTVARTAAILRRPIQGVAQRGQSGIRSCSIIVGIRNSRRKVVQVCETCAVDIHGEHGAVVRTAALRRRSIELIFQQNQNALRIRTVAVGVGRITGGVCSKTIQIRKARAIGVDGEERSIGPIAAARCRSV